MVGRGTQHVRIICRSGRPAQDSEDITQPPYDEELSTKLGSTPGAARLLVHRLRKRFRKMLETEIARTVMKPKDVEGHPLPASTTPRTGRMPVSH